MPTWFAVGMVCCLMYGTFAVWAQVRFRSYRYALDFVMGSRLQVQPRQVELGTRPAGSSTQATVLVHNHDRKPVVILGALTDCSCTTTRQLPATIPPGGTVDLPIAIRFPKVPGEWRQAIRYLTSSPGQPQLAVELHAELMAAQPTSTTSGGSKR